MDGRSAEDSHFSLQPVPSCSQIPPKISRKREIMAGVALLVSIFGFVLQTEVLGKVAMLGYQKPIFVMYITHCFMIILFPLQIVTLWLVKFTNVHEDLSTFYKKHTSHIRQTAFQIAQKNGYPVSDLFRFLCRISVILALSLNVAGASWYIAVNMTTTSDLTAIYNCSTFFAYGFSVLLLKEPVKLTKLASVLLSIVGVVIVAYLGTNEKNNDSLPWQRRVIGNIIIAFGTILYGLYEVLYKKIACPPQTVSARKQAAFANFIGSLIGVGTLLLMWPVLFILHIANWEVFEMPSTEVILYLALSIVGNVTFSGSFLILMSLTSPVLGSVSSLLATCVVPLINFIIWQQKISFGEVLGGSFIIFAFVTMSWASKDDFIEEEDV